MSQKNQEKTHWRKHLETPYLHGDEIPSDGIVVTVSSNGATTLYSKQSKQEEQKKIITFKEVEKPMVLTNRKAKQITAALGTPIVQEWVGKTFTIFPIQEKNFGAIGNVIFIRPGEIKKDEFNSKSAGWKKAVEAFKNGSATITSMKKHYELSPETVAKLESYLPKKK